VKPVVPSQVPVFHRPGAACPLLASRARSVGAIVLGVATFVTADGAIAATSAFGESATAFGLLPMLIIAVLLAAMALTGIAALLLHRRAQKALDDAQRLSALFDVAAEGIVVCSGLQVITVNPSFCRMAGVSADEAREMMISNLIAEADVIDRLLSNEDVQFETKLHADGATIAIEVTARTIDYRGTQQRLLEIRDIRDRKETQEHVSFLAHHDALTALPNRAMFNEQLSQAVRTARREKAPLAVLLFDMDNPPANGLWIAQDIGGAITGPNRVDTFWGGGEEAAQIAGAMASRGRAVLLLPRGALARIQSRAAAAQR